MSVLLANSELHPAKPKSNAPSSTKMVVGPAFKLVCCVYLI
jgi:hypothetical protein